MGSGHDKQPIMTLVYIIIETMLYSNCNEIQLALWILLCYGWFQITGSLDCYWS